MASKFRVRTIKLFIIVSREIAAFGALAIGLIISFAEIEVMIAAGRFSAIAFLR